MKRTLIIPILAFAIFSLLIVSGCKKNTPPPDFYEFIVSKGDGCVYFKWNFIGFHNSNYGVAIKYYLNNAKKVQTIFGVNSMTISGLTNAVTYAFTVVAYDGEGNSSERFIVRATPNTPFVVVSPTSSDGYSLEGGKVRIDLRFNRPADTTWTDHTLVRMNEVLQLSTGSGVSYSYTWLEKGMVLCLLTVKTKESFCSSFPCSLYLRLHTTFSGHYSIGICDTNGMELDADKDGLERGEGTLNFVL